MYYTVYQITNKLNKMIYVGVHSTENVNDNYMGSGVEITKAIKENGKEKFEKKILFIFDNYREMLEKEKEIVDLNFINRNDTYNIIIGGGQFLPINCVAVKDEKGNNFLVNKNDERYLNGELKPIAKGMVSVKDKNGKTFQTSIYDERYLNKELKSCMVGLVTVKDQYGNIFKVNKKDERYLKGEFVHHLKGKFNAIDSKGKILNIDLNDKRYLNGELKGLNKNKILVKDKNNNYQMIDKNDEQYLNGDLKHFSKDMVVVKNKNNENFLVSKFDERYLNGELISIQKNKKMSEETKKKISDKIKKIQKGKGNPAYGKCWIYNDSLEINKSIKKEQLEDFLKLNWKKGMKMKYHKNKK